MVSTVTASSSETSTRHTLHRIVEMVWVNLKSSAMLKSAVKPVMLVLMVMVLLYRLSPGLLPCPTARPLPRPPGVRRVLSTALHTNRHTFYQGRSRIVITKTHFIFNPTQKKNI